MVCNLNYTPVIVYNAVEELLALTAAGNVPNKQAQIISIGVEIIRKTQYFEIDFREQFERPAVEHTWKILKPTPQILILP